MRQHATSANKGLVKDLFLDSIEVYDPDNGKYYGQSHRRCWESHPFDDTLEKADDLCEIGYTFQRNEVIYKKIPGKKWLAEILIPDDDEFEIGCELIIENYVYKKIGEKAWLIEKIN